MVQRRWSDGDDCTTIKRRQLGDGLMGTTDDVGLATTGSDNLTSNRQQQSSYDG